MAFPGSVYGILYRMKTSYTWTSTCRTDKGNKRKINEDATLNLPDKRLWVVADGMGGHHAGDVASRMIIDTLSTVDTNLPCLSQIVNEIDVQLQKVNDQLTEMSRRNYNSSTIGSTVLCLVNFQNCVAYVWAGDSRLYRLRNGILDRMTKDHSEVQRLIDEGLISETSAETHPSANVITKAVGACTDLHVEVGVDRVYPSDIFLLCTDGLYRELNPGDITRCLIESNSFSTANELVELAIKGAATDNLSVIVAKAE